MENILSYAASAVQAMSQFALFCVVGLIIGEFPRPHGLLHEQAMSSGTALVFWIFTPCLLLSTFGAKLTPTILQDTLGIILWSLIHCILNYVIGRLFQRIAQPREGFHTAYNLSCTFNNAASIPLLLMNALCASPQLSNDKSALDRSTVFIFAYLLPWNLLFWSIGLNITQSEQDALIRKQQLLVVTDGNVENTSAVEKNSGTMNNLTIKVDTPTDGGKSTVDRNTDESNDTTNNTSSTDIQEVSSWNRYHRMYIHVQPLLKKSWTVARKALFTPPMIGIFIGVTIGLIAPLRKALFERGGTLQAVGDVITVLGAPSIPVSNLLLAGSLYHGLRDLIALRRAIKHKKLRDKQIANLRKQQTNTNEAIVDTIDVEAVILPLSPTSPITTTTINGTVGTNLSTASGSTAASSSAATLSIPSPSLLPRTYSLRITRPRAPTSESLSNDDKIKSKDASLSPIVSKIEILNRSSTPSFSSGSRGRTFSSSRERTDSNTSNELSTTTNNTMINSSLSLPKSGLGVHQMPAIASITDLQAYGAENGIVDSDTEEEDINETKLSSGYRTAPGTPIVNVPIKLNGRQISTESGSSITSNYNIPSPATDQPSTEDYQDIPDAARRILERIDVRALVEKLSQEEQTQQIHQMVNNASLNYSDNWGYYDSHDINEPENDPHYIRHSRVSMALVDPHAHQEDDRTTTARRFRSRLGSLQTDWSSSIFHSSSSTIRRRRSRSQTGNNSTSVPIGPSIETNTNTGSTIHRNVSQHSDTIYPALSQRISTPLNTTSAILLTSNTADLDNPVVNTTGSNGVLSNEPPITTTTTTIAQSQTHPHSHVTAILLRRPVLPSSFGSLSLGKFRPHSEDFLRYKKFISHYHQPFSPMPTPREEETNTPSDNNNTPNTIPEIDPKEIVLTQTEHVSLRTSAVLILVKLVIAPLILFALFALCETASIPILANSTDPVLRLVIYVEVAAPSAQSVLLLCSMVGNDAAAKDLSLVFLAMYPISIITQTLFLAVAMSIVFK